MPNLRSRLIKALTNKKLGAALADSITATQEITPFGTQTAPRVDTLANLGADTSARLLALEAKVNALIAADDLAIL